MAKLDPATLRSDFPIVRGTAEMHDAGARLPTMCWCEGDVLAVPRDIVLEGRTGSCGRRRCSAPASVSA